MHVGGRKALGLENLLRLDTVEFQDVTQENRDVSGLVSQEVLVTRGPGCYHRHGLGHGDQVRESSGEFRERNGLG